MTRRTCLAFLLALTAALPLTAQARPITVFAAASLSAAFGDLGARYEAAHPDRKVVFNFAGSQQLAAQLDQGAKAEVFASADQRWMDHARDAGQLIGTSIIFVHNRLVVITPKSKPGAIDRLQDLAKPGTKLVLAGAVVPVGKYSRDVLARLSQQPGYGADYSARVLANLVSEEDNVKAVVAKVQLREADAGVVYRSDVTPSVAKEVRVLDLPDAANIIADYPIALLASAPDSGAGREFIELVLSADGQAVLRNYGFEPITGK